MESIFIVLSRRIKQNAMILNVNKIALFKLVNKNRGVLIKNTLYLDVAPVKTITFVNNFN